ncbi:MAG: type II toxin-antitoxin system VapC family toxin [Burkholderiales bacterium]
MRSILADTGPLVALFKKRDPLHRPTVRWIEANAKRLLTTWLVVTEVCHFLDHKGKLALLRMIERDALTVVDTTAADVAELATVLGKYADHDIDLADASLVLVAERTGATEVVTIDRADFSLFRLSRNRAFTIAFP